MTHLRGSIATPRQAILLSIPLFLIGFFLLVPGVSGVVQALTDYQNSRTTSGQVVQLDVVNGVYKPVVVFRDSKGNRIQFTDPQGSKPAAYKVEDRVEVIYPPDHPEKAKINSLFEVWITPLLPIFCSGFWLVSASVFLGGGISRLRAGTR
jgi:hypothetical protein